MFSPLTADNLPRRALYAQNSRTSFSPAHVLNIRLTTSAPALFSSRLQKPTSQVAHASQSFGIGCSFGFGRSMPSASSSLASFIISYACTYFVHNLYTKTKTATNHVSNLHPRCLYAGTQNTAKKLRRVNSPLQSPYIPEVHQKPRLHPGRLQITANLCLMCLAQVRHCLQLHKM